MRIRDRVAVPRERWVLLGSFALMLLGVLVIYASRQFTNPSWQEVMLGIGLGIAPSGMLVLLSEWLVFGRLMEDLRLGTDDLQDKTDALGGEINALRVSTDFLKRSSELGLDMIYADRGVALREFVKAMENEAKLKDKKGKLIVVGSSIRGLLENVARAPQILKEALAAKCEVHILLTHPKYSTYRENQEDRPTGAIEDEIFDGIRRLESSVEESYPRSPDARLSPIVKLYKGTPTCFMIVARDRMLINPYPYEEEAFNSFCVSVRKVESGHSSSESDHTIYDQYLRAHFEKPWERNSVPYRHYWLEGLNPAEAWDRDSCYGDVFVVQDASDFYLAVNLLGQRKAQVRGLPTSIPCHLVDGKLGYLALPNSFSVRLFDARAGKWRALDREIDLLKLHAERRRGKTSGEIDGNLLNDYSMLGLFDPDGKVVNPHKHNESAPVGLVGEPLPLFWVWLGANRPDSSEKPSGYAQDSSRSQQES